MTYPFVVLIVVWVCGLLFFAGQQLNDVRVVLNNLAPDASPAESLAPRPERIAFIAAGTLPFLPSWLGITYLVAILLLGRLFNFDPTRSYSLASIDPALLNATGRDYLKKVSRHQLITLA